MVLDASICCLRRSCYKANAFKTFDAVSERRLRRGFLRDVDSRDSTAGFVRFTSLKSGSSVAGLLDVVGNMLEGQGDSIHTSVSCTQDHM